jgi:hypothetical protein
MQKLEPAVQRPPAREPPAPFFTVGRIGLCQAAKAGAVSKRAAKWSVPMWRPLRSAIVAASATPSLSAKAWVSPTTRSCLTTRT